MKSGLISISQVASSIPFNNDSNGFVSTDVQAAIEELSTNSDVNFSYKFINAGEIIEIAAEQQMIVVNQVRVDGDLVVDGELYVTEIKQLDPVVVLPPDNFSYFNIQNSIVKVVPQNQEMYVRDSIRVDGNLLVEGQVAVGGTPLVEVLPRLTNNVLQNQQYTVQLDEEYTFRNYLKVNGEVINNGFITIGA